MLAYSSRAVVELRDESTHTRVLLVASTRDPFAVTMRVETREGDVDWVFSRQLLEHPTAPGDQVMAVSTVLSGDLLSMTVQIHGSTGIALVHIPVCDVEAFLALSGPLVSSDLAQAAVSADLDNMLDKISQAD